MLQRVARPLSLVARAFSSSTASVEEVTSTTGAFQLAKSYDYYKTLDAQETSARPPDWDSAKPFNTIPGPKPLPIVGNGWRFLPLIGEFNNVATHEMFSKFENEYGPIMTLKGLPGRADMVYLFDPKDVEYFLRNAGIFPKRSVMEIIVHYRNVLRRDIFKGLDGLFTMGGEDWFKMRSMVNAVLLTHGSLHPCVPQLNEVADELVENMRYYAKNDAKSQMPSDFINQLYNWALESVGVLALRKRFGCLDIHAPEHSESKMLVHAVRKLIQHLYYFEIYPAIWKFISTPLYRDFVKNMDCITNILKKNLDPILVEKIDESIPDRDLSVLQRLVKQDKRVAFTLTSDMLLAGVDTSGKTLGANLYYLAKHPDKQAILRDEIYRVLGSKDAPVTVETMGKMPYLRAVIREASRLATTSPGSLRTTIKEMVLAGYQIPKGVHVAAISFPSARSPLYFKDPEKYIPERWLRDNKGEYSSKNAHPFASIPFGFGPRSCPGVRFANLELEVVTTTIIKNFELSWEYPEMSWYSDLFYGVKDPLRLTIKEHVR